MCVFWKTEPLLLYSYCPTAKPEINLRNILVVKNRESDKTKCEATGLPKPIITWHYKGRKLRNGDHSNSVKFRDDGLSSELKTVSILSIVMAENGLNDGRFICKASNKMGSENKTLQVLVACEYE